MNLFYFKRKSDDTIYDRTTITDGADIVYNNATELFTYNINNRNYHFYNSAVYVHDANNDPSIMAYEALIIVRNSGISLSSPSGINGQLNTNRNGYYSTSYFIYVPEGTVDDGGFRNAWSSAVARNTWDFINESNIPTFTDYNEYLAYTQGPYYDPHATVKVNYMIPEGDYQYCKLTYKADYQPENQNDGTSIDISPSGSSVNVEGLDENQLYYFTLFTDKSESEPFPFTATPDPVPPQYREKCNAIASDVVYGHKFTELELWMRYESNIPQFKCDYISGNRMSYFGSRINENEARDIYFSNGIAKIDFNSSTNEMTVTGFTGNPIGFYADAFLGQSASDYRYGNGANRLVYNTWSTSYAIWTNNNYLILEDETISYTTSFNSIGDCIDYLYSNFRHVDFYVDNELWFKATN